MNILKRLFVTFLAGLMGTLLIVLAWTSVGLATIHNRQVVKGWFDKSNFYSRIVDITLNNIANKDANSSTSNLPISDPAVQKVAKEALNPTFLKNTVETTLDSVYSWLDGDQKNLTFSIDLSSVKQQLVSGLGSYAADRAKTLPACGVIGENSPVDPFAATCLPSSVTPAQVGALAEKNILEQDFLKNPTITANDLKIKNKNGESIPITSDKRANLVRTTYYMSSLLPYALTALTGLIALGVVLMSPNKLKGLKRIGTVFLTTGISLGLLYALVKYAFNWASKRVLNNSGAKSTLQDNLGIDFIRVILNDIERVLLIFAAVYVVAGIAAKLSAYFIRKRNKTSKAASEPQEVPEEDIIAVEKPEQLKPKPVPIVPTAPKVPRKIQL